MHIYLINQIIYSPQLLLITSRLNCLCRFNHPFSPLRFIPFNCKVIHMLGKLLEIPSLRCPLRCENDTTECTSTRTIWEMRGARLPCP